MSTPVWLITGARTGFGAAVAKVALARGHRVIATARSSSSLSDLAAAGAHVMDLDVTVSDADLASKFAEAAKVYGSITHVLNCAGYILEGAVEESSDEETAAIFRTNVLGAFNVTKAAVPHLRAAAAGSAQRQQQPVIAHFGSVGSWMGAAAAVHYCSTKWAVSGLTEGLVEELSCFGIAACVIEPGYFRTEFLNTPTDDGGAGTHRVQTAVQLDVYEGTPAQQYRAAIKQHNNKQLGDVVKGAQVIVDVMTKSGVAEGREIPARLVLGSDCFGAIRKKCEDTLKLLKEWEDISTSTDHK